MKTTTTQPRGSDSSAFAIGDWVKISGNGRWPYEVAEIKMYPHGPMVGIYDEPPSKHVDFWNPSSLKLVRKANAKAQAPDGPQ